MYPSPAFTTGLAAAIFTLALNSGLVLAAAEHEAGATLNKADTKFVERTAQGELLVITSSELALKRTVSGEERVFAQKMVEEHGALADELKTLAHNKGVTLPTALDDKMQKKIDKLGKEDDKGFPAAYVACQVEAHKAAVSAYRDASESAKDRQVKGFASEYLPKMQAHLDEAQKLAKKY